MFKEVNNHLPVNQLNLLTLSIGFALSSGAYAADAHFVSVNNPDTSAINYANDGATGTDAIALGVNTTNASEDGINIGTGATSNAMAHQTIAIGRHANANNDGAIAIGDDAVVSTVNLDDYLSGNTSNVSGDWGIAIGNKSQALGEYSVAIGGGEAGSGEDGSLRNEAGIQAVAIGYGSSAGYKGTALGYGANAPGMAIRSGHTLVELGASTAIGYKASTGSYGYGTSIGGFSTATGVGGVAVGSHSVSTGVGSIAIGGSNEGATATSQSLGAKSSGIYSIAIGGLTNASANYVITMGLNSHSNASGVVALGAFSSGTAENGVALGVSSNATRDAASATHPYIPLSATDADRNAVMATIATTGAVSVGSTGTVARQITNVAAGSEDSDAVNVAQLKAVEFSSAANSAHFYSVNSTDTAAGNYNNDGATGANALAAGVGATATGDRNIAIGNGAIAGSVFDSIAIGNGANVQTRSGIAIGSGASVDAVRTDGNGEGYWGVALGNNTNVYGEYGVAIGGGNVHSGAGGNMVNSAGVHGSALGYGAQAGYNGTALGYGAEAPGSITTIFGTEVELGYSTAVGYKATTGDLGYGTSIGGFSTASNVGAVAVGNNTDATGQGSIAIGGSNIGGSTNTHVGAQATGDRSIAIGMNSAATAENAIVIGGAGIADAEGSIAVGADAHASVENGVALGRNSVADRDAASGASPYVPSNATDTQESAINVTAASTGAVSVGGNGDLRQITNVAAGSNDSDAVNVAQLNAVQTHFYSVNNTDDTVAGNYNNDGATGNHALAAGIDTVASGRNGVGIGREAIASGNSSIAVGFTANASNQDAMAFGYGSNAYGEYAISMGQNSAAGESGIAIGRGSSSVGEGSLAIGFTAEAVGQDGVAVGYGSKAEGIHSVAVGDQTFAGDRSIAIGYRNNAMGVESLAMGPYAEAIGNQSIALGRGAITSSDGNISIGFRSHTAVADATAIGNNATVTTVGGIALGNGSVANRDAASGNSPYVPDSAMEAAINATAATTGAVSVGGNSELRQITNVAAGSEDSDAVNVAQLKAVQTMASAGWDVSAQGANATNVGTGSATGSSVDLNNADGNIVVSKTTDSNDVTFDLNKDIDLGSDGSLVIGDIIVNNGGVAVGDDVTLGNTGLIINNGPSITTGGINAGNLAITNVAPGVNGTDAVNVNQLRAAGSVVEAGTNVASVDAATNADGGTTYTVNANGAKVSGGSSALTVAETTDNTTNVTDYAIDLSQETKDDIQKGIDAKDTVDNQGITFAGDTGADVSRRLGDTLHINGGANAATALTDGNIGVVADGTDTLAIKLNKDIDLGSDGSLVIGDTVVNNAGVAVGDDVALGNTGLIINGGPSITTGGINAGNLTITNVAPGVDGTDAVNVNQLRAAGSVVEAGTNVASVDVATNADGGTTYTVNANGASVSGGSSALTVAGTTDSTTNVTDYAIDISQETKDDIQKGIDAKDIVDNQGITFAGDTGSDVSRKLGDTLHINGGANEATALTDGNIGVVADGTDTLAIKLNKDIDLGSDGSLTIGGTTINGNSINATNLTVNGETHLGNHFTVNNDGSVHYDGPITDGDNIVNKDYVDNSINGSGNNNPLTFIGDDGTHVARELGEELTVEGGADAVDLTENNIGVVGNADTDGLEIKLTKNINLSSSGSLTIGDTLINTSGLVINNGPSITNVGVDAGGMKITNVAPGLISADSTDAVNGSQLYALSEVINNMSGGGSGSWNIDTDNSHTPSENTPVSDTGSTEVNSGDTVTVVAGDNIDVSHDGRSVTVATVANPTFNNVTANAVNVGNTMVDNSGIHIISSGDSSRTVSLTGDGLDNGGNTITNVAPGVNGTDAVNVNQLNQVGGQINNAINQLNHNINEVDKRASSGIASAMATAGLPQAYMPGKSMVAAAGGTYRGRNAVAIGVSSISDSGKWVLKGTASVNEHDAGASVGVGYQW